MTASRLPILRGNDVPAVMRSMAKRRNVPEDAIVYDAASGVVRFGKEVLAEVIPEDVFSTSDSERSRFQDYWRTRQDVVLYSVLQPGIDFGAVQVTKGPNGLNAAGFDGPLVPKRVVDDTPNGLKVDWEDALLFSRGSVGGDDELTAQAGREAWDGYLQSLAAGEERKQLVAELTPFLEGLVDTWKEEGPEAAMLWMAPEDRPYDDGPLAANVVLAQLFDLHAKERDFVPGRDHVVSFEFTPVIRPVGDEYFQVHGAVEVQYSGLPEPTKFGFAALVQRTDERYQFVLAVG